VLSNISPFLKAMSANSSAVASKGRAASLAAAVPGLIDRKALSLC